MNLSIWQRLVRLGFRLLYNEMAWSYDVVSWLVSMGAWREWQQCALPFVIGGQILEIGHGPGHMLAALESVGRATVGIDLSSYMGKLAKRRTSAALVTGRVEELPFSGASFDTALSTFPTEYIMNPQALTAVYRVLKPGGRFIVVPEGHLTGSGPVHRLIEWLYQVTGQRTWPSASDDPTSNSFVNPFQIIKQRFEMAGFVVSMKHIRLRRSSVTVLIACK